MSEEIKSLPVSVMGPRIIVFPIEIPEKSLSGIILPNKGIDRMDLNNSKKQETKAQDLFDTSSEHPYQAIIVAVGKEAEEFGLKVGDIVYTSYTLPLSRDVIKINDTIFVVMGMASVYCVVGNKKLEQEKIKSILL